jgi:putative PIN family toxin of toxin-antitoxin system
MTRTSLDVNVLVSAVISPRGIPHQLLLAWKDERYTLVTSEHIIGQLTAKLSLARIGGRYGITAADATAVATLLRNQATLVDVPADEVRPITGDPEDDAVLAAARLGRVEYLVTGDAGLRAISPYEGIAIVRPRDFWEYLNR